MKMYYKLLLICLALTVTTAQVKATENVKICSSESTEYCKNLDANDSTATPAISNEVIEALKNGIDFIIQSFNKIGFRKKTNERLKKIEEQLKLLTESKIKSLSYVKQRHNYKYQNIWNNSRSGDGRTTTDSKRSRDDSKSYHTTWHVCDLVS